MNHEVWMRLTTVHINFIILRVSVGEFPREELFEVTIVSVHVVLCYILQYFFGKTRIVSSSLWGYLTEWLRWWTRNPLGNSRVGSNPAVVELTREFPSGFLVHHINHSVK